MIKEEEEEKNDNVKCARVCGTGSIRSDTSDTVRLRFAHMRVSARHTDVDANINVR